MSPVRLAKRIADRLWVVLALAGAMWVMSPAMAFQADGQAMASMPLTALPPQGQAVMKLIAAGGPFPYDKDGSVFGNRERLLPSKKRGYYREYTVATPGVKHRGARRIVCGGTQLREPDACYYTADHYASFKLIVQGQ